MKLGLGLYRHMLNREHYRFARQCGATHLVIHMVDYTNAMGSDSQRMDQPLGGESGWGRTGTVNPFWTLEELSHIKSEIESEGLQIAAIENLDPALWYDVLLDGPRKAAQLEDIKALIRRMGELGIPCLGYNFSLAGVASRVEGPYARGGAISVGMEGGVDERPIPKGMIWNMVYDPDAPREHWPRISHEVLWKRLKDFLQAVLPTAEEVGVSLAAHPDDPPLPWLRDSPRLVYEPDLYQRLIDLVPSSANQLEYCLGSLSEMQKGDVHEATEQYASQGKIAYVHVRNVRGKVPNYKEVFIDEGDVDILRILQILQRHNFEGVLIPDHTPQMSCAAPWHAGMAYTLGYLKGLLQGLDA